MKDQTTEGLSVPQPMPQDPATQLSEPCLNSPADVAVQGRWLVFASLLLAIFIEVLPNEVEFILIAVRERNLLLFFVTKAICLPTILGPLCLYIWLNGWKGIWVVKGRVIAIGIIVGLTFIRDIWCLTNLILCN